jgi:hypothetical protein
LLFTWLEFLETMELSVEEVVGKILKGKKRPLLFEQAAGPTRGVGIIPPQRITVFNGSPRGRRGNTRILLSEFIRGFWGEYEMHYLVRVSIGLESRAVSFRLLYFYSGWRNDRRHVYPSFCIVYPH